MRRLRQAARAAGATAGAWTYRAAIAAIELPIWETIVLAWITGVAVAGIAGWCAR